MRSLAYILFLAVLFTAASAVFGQTVRVLAIGDSITDGYPSSEPSYRLPFWDLMQARNRSFRMVGNRVGNYNGLVGGIATTSVFSGWPGTGWPVGAQRHAAISGVQAVDYANGILTGALNAMGPSEVPDVVLLHLGTNDMGFNRSAAATANALSSIIDQLRAYNPRVRILLAQVIPAGNSFPGSNYPAVSQLNALIPGLAASQSTALSPVIVVDHNAGFNVPDFIVPSSYEPLDTFLLDPDNIHPNLAGQAEMARRWLAAYEQVEPPPVVAIQSPAHGVSIAPGVSVIVGVGAVAARGVDRVELYANGIPVGSRRTAPFEFTYEVTTAGPVVLSALVFDSEFQEAVSKPVMLNPVSADLSSALQGMCAWYRSDTLVESASGAVRRWRDLSGNQHHLFQRDSASRPVLASQRFRDKPGLVFGGANFLTSYSGMPVDRDFTKVVVFKLADTTSLNNLISSATSPNGAHALWYGGSDRAQLYRFGSFPDLSLSYAVSSIATRANETSTLMSTFRRADRNGRLYQDNVLGASATAFRGNSEASLQIGAYNGFSYLNGEIAEIIIYDRVLGAAERTALQVYLDARYKRIPNQAPMFPALATVAVHAGEALTVDASASDPDFGQTLVYSIESGPDGIGVDSLGMLSWPVPADTSQGDYPTTILVTDSGTPPLSDRATFDVAVHPPPAITAIASIAGAPGGCQIDWSGIPGRAYTVESAGGLASPAWAPVGSGTVLAGQGSALVPAGNAFEVFRVR